MIDTSSFQGKTAKYHTLGCKLNFSETSTFARSLREMGVREAKKDERLKTSGRLREFRFYQKIWPLEPKTLFYDWLYINALSNNETIASSILQHDCFTDIEFNHERSINCQAYSAALYVSLSKKGLLEEALKSPSNYTEIINSYKIDGAYDNISNKQRLL